MAVKMRYVLLKVTHPDSQFWERVPGEFKTVKAARVAKRALERKDGGPYEIYGSAEFWGR